MSNSLPGEGLPLPLNVIERRPNIWPLVTTGLCLAAGLAISTLAFTRQVRQQIMERDNYQCQGIGPHLGGLEAAHFNHDKRAENYNSPSNGQILCTLHHLLQHMMTSPAELGLNSHSNAYAIKKTGERVERSRRR